MGQSKNHKNTDFCGGPFLDGQLAWTKSTPEVRKFAFLECSSSSDFKEGQNWR